MIALGRVLERGHRDQPRRRRLGEFLKALRQRPKHQPQPGWRGFQQQRHEDGELAKAQPVFAQGCARVLIQFLDLLRHIRAGQDAQAFDQTEGKAAREAGQGFVALQGQQRFEQGGDLAVNEMLQAALDLLRHVRAGHVIDKHLDAGFQRFGACDQLANAVLAPHQPTLFGKVDFGIGRVVKPVRPQVELRRERLSGHRLERLFPGPLRILVRGKPEPFEPSDKFAFDAHVTIIIHIGQEGLLLFEPAQQH